MAAATLTVAGCAAGPTYVAPQTPPATFEEAPVGALLGEPLEAAWWSQFGDPELDSLVRRALGGDLDVRVAAARLTQARALLSKSERARWPSAPVAISSQRQDAQIPGFGDRLGNDRIESDTYQAGLSVSWELDFFGRARRGAQAARNDAQAAEARLHDAQVLVAAEVASTYIELRGAQKRLRVAQDNLVNLRETLRLTRVRYQLGRGDELDVASAEARLDATEADIPPLVAAERAAAHRLAVLLGERPGELDAELEYVEMPPHLTTLAVGAPEDLLRRRPDVRAAERELAAATARVGVAKADLFPRVTLTGFLGFIAGDASELGEAASRAWTTSPVLRWTGFDLGAQRAELRVSEARVDEALAVYERTVLGALEETQNAFVGYAQQRARLASLVEQADASHRAADLARVQYREGALDFLRLLDAERTELEAADAVAAAEAQLNTSVVAIYKALGGGWEAAPPAA
ncbi:MAG TPA: efflux transporter outer membrane subunit [Gammaproteobacteria bacterium]|nr:efflux transporter outer membrane subunit [Gammaproteobacteria bacterium]